MTTIILKIIILIAKTSLQATQEPKASEVAIVDQEVRPVIMGKIVYIHNLYPIFQLRVMIYFSRNSKDD
jgi:hypothetical protein